MSRRDQRIGANEALFREVNERIDQLHDNLGGVQSFEIVCECGDADCVERFTIASEDYEALRSDVHQFAVVPEHVDPSIERPIERHERYVVVKKVDPDAAEAAEKMA